MTPTFTPAAIKEDGQNRVAKTAGQAGVAGAIVTVGEWAAHQSGWTGDLPIVVATSMVTLLTAAAAWWTNRARLRGEA